MIVFSRRSRESLPEDKCGHTRHVGSCPTCQQAQLERWREQLAAVTRAVPPEPRPGGRISAEVPVGDPPRLTP